LDCCDGAEKEETCELNAKCAVLNLTGACCPTIDGFGYLDCCDAFPSVCVDPSDDECNITSATDYLEFLADNAREISGVSSVTVVASSIGAILAVVILLV